MKKKNRRGREGNKITNPTKKSREEKKTEKKKIKKEKI